jgi:hypothetical protein
MIWLPIIGLGELQGTKSGFKGDHLLCERNARFGRFDFQCPLRRKTRRRCTVSARMRGGTAEESG